MPFPLAHPAAVLPLRRYCPKYLSFPALVVGSVCPDAGYCLSRFNASDFSHQWLGSFGFCLPMGLIILLFMYGVMLPVIERMPERFRKVLALLPLKPLGPPSIVILSLLVGIWTHLLWDSFTHTDGWFVQHLPVLKTPIASLADRTLRVCHLLWYSSSFGGLILLFLAYDRWQQRTFGSPVTELRINWRGAILLAILVVPIELVHHLVHGALGRYLVAASTLGLGIGITLRIIPTGKDRQMRTPIGLTGASATYRPKGSVCDQTVGQDATDENRSTSAPVK
jgi:hypothetical protein